MDYSLKFRLPPELQAQVEQFVSEYRRKTGENITVSRLLRRCLDIALKQHRAELIQEGRS